MNLPLCMLLLAVAVAAEPAPDATRLKPISPTRIRCLDPNARQLLQHGVARSPTIARLATRIELSDVIVFVVMRLSEGGPAGKTQIITAAPGARYLMVTLDPRAPLVDQVGRLGHELQHVAEIADAPEVTSEEGLRALFSRIGWQARRANNWETAAAVLSGRQAAREAAGGPL